MKSRAHQSDPVGERALEALGDTERYSAWQLATVQAFVGDRVLEIGSGIGNTSAQLLRLRPEALYLTDQNDSYLARLQRRFAAYPEVDVRALSLPLSTVTEWAKLQVDTIVAFNVIEHVEDHIGAVGGLAEILKPAGHFLMLVPAHPTLMCPLDHELGHFRRYTVRSAAELLVSAGLTPIQSSYFNFPGAIGWLWRGGIRRQRELSPNGVKLFDRLVPVLKWADRLSLPFGLSVATVGRK